MTPRLQEVFRTIGFVAARRFSLVAAVSLHPAAACPIICMPLTEKLPGVDTRSKEQDGSKDYCCRDRVKCDCIKLWSRKMMRKWSLVLAIFTSTSEYPRQFSSLTIIFNTSPSLQSPEGLTCRDRLLARHHPRGCPRGIDLRYLGFGGQPDLLHQSPCRSQLPERFWVLSERPICKLMDCNRLWRQNEGLLHADRLSL